MMAESNRKQREPSPSDTRSSAQPSSQEQRGHPERDQPIEGNQIKEPCELFQGCGSKHCKTETSDSLNSSSYDPQCSSSSSPEEDEEYYESPYSVSSSSPPEGEVDERHGCCLRCGKKIEHCNNEECVERAERKEEKKRKFEETKTVWEKKKKRGRNDD